MLVIYIKYEYLISIYKYAWKKGMKEDYEYKNV